MNKTSVIIVHFGNPEPTRECLKSLSTNKSQSFKTFLVVLNNEKSLFDDAKRLYSQLEIVPIPKNLGFAGGINYGIRESSQYKPNYYLILNNDTIVSPELIPKLENISNKNSQIGLISPKIYFYPGQEYHKERYKPSERGSVFWYAGGKIDWKNVYASHRGVDEIDVGQYDDMQETDFATGCCMFVNGKLIEKIGFMNERYFLYYEDVDYSLRTHRAGYRVIYYPQAKIWHKNAVSSGKPGSSLHVYYQTRNRIYFGLKYAPFRTRFSLVRESVGMLFNDNIRKKAILDYYKGKMGEQTV